MALTTVKENEIVELMMKESGCMLEGHFELSSGVHTEIYFQCAKLLQYPKNAEYAGSKLADLISIDVDTILSPAVGGIIIGYVVARSLNLKSLFVERKEGNLSLRRGFNLKPGEKVFIIEDVITTAKSALETAAIAKSFGAEVKGFGCILDRSNGSTGLDIKSLYQVSPVIYQPDDCPLCKAGIPIEKPGSKAKVLHN
jgi:orotate phosphoribosyltransferase